MVINFDKRDLYTPNYSLKFYNKNEYFRTQFYEVAPKELELDDISLIQVKFKKEDKIIFNRRKVMIQYAKVLEKWDKFLV